jgi:hypothetical protein
MTLPPATKLIKGTNYGELSQENTLFQLSVFNGDKEIKSRGGENVLQYSKLKTPMLADVIPNQVYRGQKIQYIINPMRALIDGAVASGELPIQELALGNVKTNWAETIDAETTLSAYQYKDPLNTIVGNHPPTKDVKPRALFRVGDSYVMDTAKHCNFDGTDCWTVRVHPVIDKINAVEGSVLGGQELKIKGYGLNGDAEVLVDGVKCDVRSTSEDEIICSTGEKKTGPSQNGYQPGSPGLIQTTIVPKDDTIRPDWKARFNNKHDRTLTHLTTFETHANELLMDGKIIDGFFRAPETGEYKFRLSSNDESKLFLS